MFSLRSAIFLCQTCISSFSLGASTTSSANFFLDVTTAAHHHGLDGLTQVQTGSDGAVSVVEMTAADSTRYHGLDGLTQVQTSSDGAVSVVEMTEMTTVVYR